MYSDCQMQNNKTTVVYACAGCADVGSITDQIGRKLRHDGFATPKASCLAGIGAGIQSFIDAAKGADRVITIDGCDVECAKKTLENIGIQPQPVILTRMGLEKDNASPTPALVNDLCQTIVNQFK
jgi:uncharacterized metal-binding protein